MTKLVTLVCCFLAAALMFCDAEEPKKNSPSKDSDSQFRKSLIHQYSLSVANRLAYLTDFLREGPAEDASTIEARRKTGFWDMAIQAFAVDLCYLHYLGKEVGGGSARRVSEDLAFAFRQGYLDKRDFFSKEAKFLLILPSSGEQPTEVSPKEILESIKLSPERFKELQKSFKTNWREK